MGLDPIVMDASGGSDNFMARQPPGQVRIENVTIQSVVAIYNRAIRGCAIGYFSDIHKNHGEFDRMLAEISGWEPGGLEATLVGRSFGQPRRKVSERLFYPIAALQQRMGLHAEQINERHLPPDKGLATITFDRRTGKLQIKQRHPPDPLEVNERHYR